MLSGIWRNSRARLLARRGGQEGRDRDTRCSAVASASTRDWRAFGSADQSDCVAALLNADRLCDAVVARQQAPDAAAPTSFRARFGPWIFLQRVFG
jgi:hypothetical protein